MICIWCKKDFDALSVEHGIPEGLGCPPSLELRDVACKRCNNALSRVDRALVKQFEIITVIYGVRRKKGRAPTINSWIAVRSTQRPDGPHIMINGGPGVVEADGNPLHPATNGSGISGVWARPESGQMGFTQAFGDDRYFLPALYKVGLNLVAKQFGSVEAAGPKYDHVREYVRLEATAPVLTAAMDTCVLSSPVTETTLIAKPGRQYPMFRVTILGVTFLLDMAPDQPGLRDLRAAATLYGEALYVFPSRRAA